MNKDWKMKNLVNTNPAIKLAGFAVTNKVGLMAMRGATMLGRVMAGGKKPATSNLLTLRQKMQESYMFKP